jgi:hypothetical protein
MHTKNLWVGVDGVSHKGTCFRSWSAFLDCIELHKLTICPMDAAEKQRYYMMQMVKKPQQVTVCQYMARMGILNDYLAHLPMVFNSSMVVEGMKKGNVPFDEADLAGIVLNSVPVSWSNQYNMTHQMLPSGTRALLQDLEPIKYVIWMRSTRLVSRQRQRIHLLPRLPREVPRSIPAPEIPMNESQRRPSPASSASTARQRAGPT